MKTVTGRRSATGTAARRSVACQSSATTSEPSVAAEQTRAFPGHAGKWLVADWPAGQTDQLGEVHDERPAQERHGGIDQPGRLLSGDAQADTGRLGCA